MAGKSVSDVSIDEPVRPRKSSGASSKLRKLWGLEDVEDEFGAGEGWTSEEQRIFDEAGRREAIKQEERGIG